MRDKYTILKNYMEEDGFLCGRVFVVWLHGATDGWPQAMFTSHEAAEKWVETIRLNPEGYSIEAIDFLTLCQTIVDG
jgi:hypothetical protein